MKAGAIAGLGAALAIGVMEWLSASMNYPLAVIPFATSIVLVIGSPDAPPAQPRALIGGHLVATLVGLMVLHAAVCRPRSIAAMSPWTFVVAPVLAGALLLTAFALVWHRWVRRQPWPEHWL